MKALFDADAFHAVRKSFMERERVALGVQPVFAFTERIARHELSDLGALIDQLEAAGQAVDAEERRHARPRASSVSAKQSG